MPAEDATFTKFIEDDVTHRTGVLHQSFQTPIKYGPFYVTVAFT